MGITKMMLNSTPTGLNAHYINMFQTRGNAFLKSLGILCAAFVAVNVVGVPTPASAQDVDIETCANLRVPETVNLLSLDSTLAKCLNLYPIANQWNGFAGRVNNALSGLDVGNAGKNEIQQLSYNIPFKEITLKGTVRAKQVTTIKVPNFRESHEQVPVPGTEVRHFKECLIPNLFSGGCEKWVEKDVSVPVVRMEWRTIKVPDGFRDSEETLYSATCNYTYSYNLNTQERKPVLECGRGGLGGAKFDASSIASLLNGEIPSIGSLLTSLDWTPLALVDKSEDRYESIRSRVVNGYPGAQVYFSSQTFVNYASTKNQAVTIAVDALSGGAITPELYRQLEEKLKLEFEFFSSWAVQAGLQISIDQFLGIIQGKPVDMSGFSVKFATFNVPNVYSKCLANTTYCKGVNEPRLGFALIVYPGSTNSDSIREEAWKKYYQNCGGNGQSMDDFARQWRGSFDANWSRYPGRVPVGCG